MEIKWTQNGHNVLNHVTTFSFIPVKFKTAVAVLNLLRGLPNKDKTAKAVLNLYWLNEILTTCKNHI
jgi:hypothetical protein